MADGEDDSGSSLACGWVAILIAVVFLISMCVTGLLVSVFVL